MSAPAAGHVLRLAVAGWGLGHLALGLRRTGTAWLAAEVIAALAVVVATVLWVDTSWYLVPFLLGMAFLVAWVVQAVAAYHRARHREGAVAPAPSRSPALVVAWLTLPLLAWGTGYWLVAASAATPAAVVDRFVSGWTGPARPADFDALGEDPLALSVAARDGIDRLRELCAAGDLPRDCALARENLLRDVRIRVIRDDGDTATVVAELVRYRREPTRLLGLLETTSLVAVPTELILRLELAARPAALGAERWTIVNADAS